MPDPSEIGAQCKTCPFSFRGSADRPVWGEGPEDPIGILVGEGPGRDEQERGRPFVGATGKRLDEALLEARLARANLFVLNATLCRPPLNKTEVMMRKAVDCCRAAFQHQLPVKVRPIFAMGKWAMHALAQKSHGLQTWRGFLQEWAGRPLIQSWHPTFAAFHSPYDWGSFVIDLDRFARLIRGQLEATPREKNISPTADDLERFARRARKLGWCSLDIETKPQAGDEDGHTAKNALTARLQLLGLGFPDEALCVEWKRASASVRRAVRSILADPDVEKVLQNGWWYDLRVLPRYGIETVNVFDTRDARRAVSSTSALGLEHMGSIYCDYPAWKRWERESGGGKVVHTKNMRRKKRYNCDDCIVTARVRVGLLAEPEWREQRVRKLYDHQTRLSQIAAKMHTNGVKINKVTREFLAWGLEKQYDRLERRVVKLVDVEGFRCTPNHLRAVIFARHAVGKYAHLKKFQLPDPINPEMYVDPKQMETISVDENSVALLLIDPTTPELLKRVLKAYWEAESTWKLRSTMVTSKLIDDAIGQDGRLRPGWNSCGTDTGRFSCSEPNLMTVKEYLRGMYVAEEGNLLVGGDYSQLELRVMAAVAQDKALAEALKTGDVYTAEAIDYFDLPKDTTRATIKKAARDATKTIRLGRQYGSGIKAIYRGGVLPHGSHQVNLDFTWDKAEALMRAFDRRNWRTVAYWDEEMQRVHACGYSETRIMQRRRYYPYPPERTDVSNYPIQGTAADIKNLALIELDKRLNKEAPKAMILIDLHDAIYCEAPEKDAERVKKIMQEVMEVDHLIDGERYAFPVKMKIGKAWDEF